MVHRQRIVLRLGLQKKQEQVGSVIGAEIRISLYTS